MSFQTAEDDTRLRAFESGNRFDLDSGPELGEEHASVICVDLDGTLIQTDLLLESFLAVFRDNPFVIFLVPLWLLHGKARLKMELGARATLDVSSLPYNAPLIEYLRERRSKGDRVYLATAAHAQYAHAVARHLNIFDGVLATEHGVNLSGARKLGAIRKLLCGSPFSYVGNGSEDIVIWREASATIMAGNSVRVRRALQRYSLSVSASFPFERRTGWKDWFGALRVYQWSKNLLVFTPVLLSHRFEPWRLLESLSAFFCWSACASGFYIVNDLLDIAADRAHPTKRRRPIASGQLSIQNGLALAAVSFGISIGLSFTLPIAARGLLALYAAFNLAYSTRLKEALLLDVMVLAGFYTLRVIYGGTATGITVSIWTLAFCMFLFLGLALVKRLTELTLGPEHSRRQPARRAYLPCDSGIIMSLASAALYLCVLVLALYINSPEVSVLYRRPQALWTVCILLLYWVSRVLILTNRGKMSDDPIVFAFRDHGSQIVGTMVALCVWLAL